MLILILVVSSTKARVSAVPTHKVSGKRYAPTGVSSLLTMQNGARNNRRAMCICSQILLRRWISVRGVNARLFTEAEWSD